jgi:hypothetical protein
MKARLFFVVLFLCLVSGMIIRLARQRRDLPPLSVPGPVPVRDWSRPSDPTDTAHWPPAECWEAARTRTRTRPLTPRCQLHFFMRGCDLDHGPSCTEAGKLTAQGVEP